MQFSLANKLSSARSLDQPVSRPAVPLRTPHKSRHFSRSDLRTTSRRERAPMDLAHGLPVLFGKGVEKAVDMACSECESLTEPAPVAECENPQCADAITSECTDQCIVYCDDPSHTPAVVPVCDGGNDCPGLDDFLQCCTDMHVYLSEPNKMIPGDNAPLSFTWERDFEAFLCSCSEGPTHTLQSHNQIHADGPPQFPSAAQHLPGTFSAASTLTAVDSTQLVHHSRSHRAPSPGHPSRSNLTQVSHAAQTDVLICMWDNCQMSFTSMAELVGHVNLDHLRASAPASPPTPHSHLNLSSSSGGMDLFNNLSCQWGDCQLYPTPESIPGPSGDGQLYAALGLLTTHLMKDHLGIQSSPLSTPALPSPESSTTLTAPTPSSRSRSSTASVSPAPGMRKMEKELSEAEPATFTCHWLTCTRSFKTCDALTAHIDSDHVGSGQAHYNCFWEGCTRHGEQGFGSKQKIKRHLQSHTGHRPFQCDVCQQNFSEAATLQQHMRRHAQQKPYVCDFPGCGKAFTVTGALTIHKRTHNGQKPFKCTFCNKAFAESSNLSKHLRTHTGAKPYPCTECQKAFARPDQLARHMGVHRKSGQVTPADEMVMME